jgi:hypothetical protein
MAALTGNSVASTYKDLLQVSNSNSGVDATLRTVDDGEGTASALKVSTGAIQVDNIKIDGNTITSEDTNGNITLTPNGTGDVEVSTGNLVIGTAGKGISFAATSDAGGMTSELLDDYEEGTWVPVYAPATGSFTTMTMDVQNASYTKIGRVVTVAAYMRTDNVDATGASGNLKITGLPFTSLGGDHQGCVSIGYVQDFASGESPDSGYVNNGQSYITITERSAVDGDSSSCQVDTLTTGSNANDNEIMFIATYFTA